MRDESHDPTEAPAPTDAVDRARRRLLRGAVYVAPAIVGTMATRRATAQTSCAPSSCGPNGGACGPSFCNPRR